MSMIVNLVDAPEGLLNPPFVEASPGVKIGDLVLGIAPRKPSEGLGTRQFYFRVEEIRGDEAIARYERERELDIATERTDLIAKKYTSGITWEEQRWVMLITEMLRMETLPEDLNSFRRLEAMTSHRDIPV